ncbi:MAG: hypothetical protein JRI99_12225 [Deltaproteobacteria bacterium]|nr:hypothetical protein [Deltaproteobacteria bacterium]
MIANAPNSAGRAIPKRYFGDNLSSAVLLVYTQGIRRKTCYGQGGPPVFPMK